MPSSLAVQSTFAQRDPLSRAGVASFAALAVLSDLQPQTEARTFLPAAWLLADHHLRHRDPSSGSPTGIGER